jgi:hypothetical protein
MGQCFAVIVGLVETFALRLLPVIMAPAVWPRPLLFICELALSSTRWAALQLVMAWVCVM